MPTIMRYTGSQEGKHQNLLIGVDKIEQLVAVLL